MGGLRTPEADFSARLPPERRWPFLEPRGIFAVSTRPGGSSSVLTILPTGAESSRWKIMAAVNRVLPGAENPHLGGVHDADGKPGISGTVVGAVSATSARCRSDGMLRAVIPVSGQARARNGASVQPAGAISSSRPRVRMLIIAHGLTCSSPSRRQTTTAAAPRHSSAQRSSPRPDGAGTASWS